MRVGKGSRAVCIVAAALAAAVLASGGAWAQNASIFVNFPSISPNGDGVQDMMSIVVTLSAGVDTLALTIEDPATRAVHDTLLLKAPAAAGTHSTTWDGTGASSTLLPEGEYLLHLYESAGGTGASLLRTVIIDLTSPRVTIDRVEPGVYAPGWPDTAARVTVYYNISGWETGASARMTVTDPAQTATTSSLAVSGDGEWTAWWKRQTAASGVYTVTIVVRDEAGNSDSDSGSFIVDSEGPVLEFKTQIPSNTREVPREIVGRSHDPSGVPYLQLSWTGTDNVESARFDPDSTWLAGDTLYFRFDTPDTVTGEEGWSEGTYLIRAFARDPFQHQTSKQLLFRLDRTPPSVPVIAPPPASVIVPQLELAISYGTGTDTLFVYRLHEGTTVRSTFATAALGPKRHPTVTLGAGSNEIWAAAKDRAGNTSANSNVVVAVYDPSSRITYPEAFRGPDRFQIVTERTARSVEVSIFDLRGDRVRRIERAGPGTVFDILWDLRNDGGEEVRNGAFVAVIVIDFGSERMVEKNFIAVVR